jgi:exonuclease III
MEQILLAIFFVINGEITMIEGWYPRPQESMEICEQRQEFMTNYMRTLSDMPEIAGIFCGTQDQIQDQIDIINSTQL